MMEHELLELNRITLLVQVEEREQSIASEEILKLKEVKRISENKALLLREDSEAIILKYMKLMIDQWLSMNDFAPMTPVYTDLLNHVPTYDKRAFNKLVKKLDPNLYIVIDTYTSSGRCKIVRKVQS